MLLQIEVIPKLTVVPSPWAHMELAMLIFCQVVCEDWGTLHSDRRQVEVSLVHKHLTGTHMESNIFLEIEISPKHSGTSNLFCFC